MVGLNGLLHGATNQELRGLTIHDIDPTGRTIQLGSRPHPTPLDRAYYLSHVLAPAGVRPRTQRSTRLVDLLTALDPKLVAAAFGMRPEGVLHYLADHVDEPHWPSFPPPKAGRDGAYPSSHERRRSR